METPAILALEDGTVLRGRSIGISGVAVGEICFNTAMTGYQEIITDPSYHGRLVTLTYPHGGNVGANSIDAESAKVQASGLIVRDLSLIASSWRSERSLSEYLDASGVVAIGDIDTRQLTRIVRQRGVPSGCIMAGSIDVDEALARARDYPGLQGVDLVEQVSTAERYDWARGSWRIADGREDAADSDADALKLHVVVYDFGVRRSALRSLVDAGCRVTVVPAQTPASEVLALRPDGVFLSSGPGDPEACAYGIAAARQLVEAGSPIFASGLGFQLLALASGARTAKMKFGHHGVNHPVIELASRRVTISAQSHGFTVDEASLPEHLQATHRSLFDGSLQGIQRTDRPAFGVQGHPEAEVGWDGESPLFTRFVSLMTSAQ